MQQHKFCDQKWKFTTDSTEAEAHLFNSKDVSKLHGCWELSIPGTILINQYNVVSYSKPININYLIIHFMKKAVQIFFMIHTYWYPAAGFLHAALQRGEGPVVGTSPRGSLRPQTGHREQEYFFSVHWNHRGVCYLPISEVSTPGSGQAGLKLIVQVLVRYKNTQIFYEVWSRAPHH